MLNSTQSAILGILGPKGGVGKSVFAAHFSAVLANELKKPVCLIDLDAKGAGDLNLILGLKPNKTVTELVNFTGSINQNNLNSLVSVHKSGIHYIGAIKNIDEQINVTGSQVINLLLQLSGFYPVIVIDLGTDIEEWQKNLLFDLTLIYLVTTNDILVVNQTQRYIQNLFKMTIPSDMIKIILNKYQNSGVQANVVSQNLPLEMIGIISSDEEGFSAAVNRSQLYFYSRSNNQIFNQYVDIARKTISIHIPKAKQANRSKNTQNSSGIQQSNQTINLQDNETRIVWRMKIHNELIKAMDLKKGIADTGGDPEKERQLRDKTQALITQIVDREIPNLPRDERAKIIKEVLEEALGLGPLEDLLADASISEIMVNGYNKIFVEKNGKIQRVPITFTSNAHLRNIIERIVTPVGRRIDEKTPMVDARLKDGSRVNAVIEPLAIDGPALTIRKFKKGGMTPEKYIEYGSMTKAMIEFLKICVENGLNIIISGGTGSGKTSLLNMLSSFIPSHERIITVEDAAELQLQQEHVVRLETRPANMEGTGAVTIRDLIRNALRMRPDRIVVGETRDGAALDMLQAMNTGHDGSMTTVHANNPRECISRLETLCLMAGMDLPVRAIREQIASAVDLIVQVSRLSDGSRKVISITEVVGMQGDVVSLQEIFRFKETGYDKNRRIIGEFQATGMIPTFIEDLEAKGVIIPREIFSQTQVPVNTENKTVVKNAPQIPKIKLTGS